MPANRRDRRGNVPVGRKLRLCRAGPRNEQPHGAVLQQVLRVPAALRRHGERRHPVKALTLCSQRLAARRQHARRRVGAEQCLGHARRGADEMLAIVEHQQELLRGERIRDAFGRYNVTGEVETELRGDGRRHEVGIRKRRELDSPDPVGEFRQQASCDLEAEARLADPSGTRQGDQAVGGGEAQDLLELDVAADQLGNRLGQVRRWAGWGGHLHGRPCNRLRMRARRDRADLPGKLVASSGNRADQVAVRSEGVAQGRDLDVQTALLDDPVRPDAAP